MLSHSRDGAWRFDGPPVEDAQLVLCFMAFAQADSPDAFEALRAMFPKAQIAACTTNGEILNGEVLDGVSVAAAIRFKSTEVRTAFEIVEPQADARQAGRRLARELACDGLKGVFVLADAFSFNGADLVEGLNSELPPGVSVSGGMAGDGGVLGPATKAGVNRPPCARGALAIGFYGPAVRIRHGVGGGWVPLGPSRHVTLAEGSVVYELDGQPALDVYERLVGDAASSARVRHPFCFKARADSEPDLVREVVGVDRERKGLVFIDPVPQNFWAQPMRGVDERLIEGAAQAARIALPDPSDSQALGLVVSCIGRKWVMGQRIGDETEAVQETAGVPTIGFFSYGEVAPHARTGVSTLHHASVAVTMLSEAA